MNKTEIISLAQSLCHNVASADTITQYYDDVLEDLARWRFPPLVDAELISITSGTAEYSFPSSLAIRILAFFFEDKSLSQSTTQQLEAYSTDWRTDTGDPWAYTLEDIDARKYTLYPIPDTSSGNFYFPNAEPFGEDYPANTALMFYSSARTTDIEDWIAVAIAFDILAREFAYPSDHQDLKFSTICNEMANVLYKIAGYR